MSETPAEPTQEMKDRGCICMYLFNDLHRRDCPLSGVAEAPFPTAADYGMPGGDRVTFSNERAQAASLANRMMDQISTHGGMAGRKVEGTRVEELPDGEKELTIRLDNEEIVVKGRFTVDRRPKQQTDESAFDPTKERPY